MNGKGVSPGIAIGRISFIERGGETVQKRAVTDTSAEITRFEEAKGLASSQLGELAVTTAEKLGAENALLFEIHQMMLEDLDFLESITGIVEAEKVCAEYAVERASEQFSAMLADTGDDYMKERAADVIDISRRLIGILTGRAEKLELGDEPSILAADDFTPSETAQLDCEKVLALATVGGAANSHTAIFARTMGIPAVIGLGDVLNASVSGKRAVLDGETGELIIDPDEEVLLEFRKKQSRLHSEAALLEKYRGKPARTKSGRDIKIFANIGSAADADAAVAGDAEGIGLFRSEFLFLESSDYPSEQVQYEAYKSVAEKMAGKPVIIRTLDIGADKQADYFGLPREENPALGMRAIRICLTRPEVFKTQLRALYRASAHGNIKIMLPMITSLSEIRKAKEYAGEARDSLRAEGIEFNESVPIGIMIETPASAVISDLLAKETDFFSIGTNDLTQYTLAIDRQNDSVSDFCDTRHEAILRLMRTAARNAHENGIEVGICGELASDTTLTETFIDMGIDELSVPPSSILRLRGIIAGLD